MAGEGYLPPVVTKFLADLSDLARGVATGKALVAEFARDTTDMLRSSGRDGGRAFSTGFVTEFDAGIQVGMQRTILESAGTLGDASGKTMAGVGAQAASSFGSSFKSALMPVLIASLVLLSPVIISAVASAIQLGLQLGFIGLGVFLLRQEQPLIDAATRFKSSIGAVFKDAAMPMLGPIIKGLGILENAIKSVEPEIRKIFGSLAGMIEPLAFGFAGFIAAVMPGLTELLGQPEVLQAFAVGLVAVGAGLGDMFKSIAHSGPQLAVFMKDAMIGIGQLLVFLGNVMEVSATIYGKLAALHTLAKEQGWDTPWNAIKTGASAVAGWVKSAADAVGSWFSNLGDKVSGWFSRTSTSVKNWFTNATATAGQAVDGVVAWFKALPGRVGAAVSALPGLLADAGTRAFDALFFAVGFGVTRTVQMLAALPGQVYSLVNRMWLGVTNLFLQGIHKTIGLLTFLVTAAPGFFARLWADSTSWVARTWHDTTALFARLWGDAVAWVRRTVDDVMGWFNSLPSRASTAVEKTGENIRKGFAGVKGWLFQAGKDLIAGLIEGVGSAIDWALSVIDRAAKRIIEGARKALGIQSPSTVFATIGQQTIAGYVQGINANMGLVSGAWRSMLGAVPGSPSLSADMRASMGGAALAGAGGGGQMLEATFNVDGQRLLTALVPVAQRRKKDTGSTGLD